MQDDYQLRVFLAIADAGSLTRASQVLDMSQPAVSKHLKQLELKLDKQLFNRHGRGVALSSHGQSLYEAIAPAFNKLDSAMSSLKSASQQISGHIKIATVHTLNSYFTVPVISSICRQYSALNIQVYERSSQEVSALVERKQADIGLAYDTMVSGENLLIQPLHLERMQLYYSDQLEITLNENAQVVMNDQLPIVGLPQGYALRQMLNFHFASTLNYKVLVETVDLMLEIVKSGVAACILPANYPARVIENSGLLRCDIADVDIQRRVVLLTHKDSAVRPEIDYLSARFIEQGRSCKL